MSLRVQELLRECSGAAGGTLEPGTNVQARIELAQASSKTLVVSLPKHGNALAFASIATCNTQQSGLLRAHETGQHVPCTVASSPDGAAPGRVLLQLRPPAPAAKGGKGKGKGGALGTVGEGTVRAVHALHADVRLGKRTGRLHVCELRDWRPEDVPEVWPWAVVYGVAWDGRILLRLFEGHPCMSMHPSVGCILVVTC